MELRPRNGDHHREETLLAPGRSGLDHDELCTTLELAFNELSGPPAAVRLLRRTGNWLLALDREGFIHLGPPHPDDPESRPRATVDWSGALEAAAYGGPLASRSLDVELGDDEPFALGPLDPDQPRRDLPLLQIAASLAVGVPVDLLTALRDLDRPTTASVLAAVSACTQAHVRYDRARLPDGRVSTRSSMAWVCPLYDWTDADRELAPSPPADGSRQAELGLYPAADEEAAIARAAHANPHPVAELPLSEHLVRVLGALRPGTTRGGRVRRARPPADEADRRRSAISRRMLQHSRDEVERWLGRALPVLPTEGRDVELVCLRHRNFWEEEGDHPLPARGSTIPNGEPWALSLVLAWPPVGTDLTRTTLDELRLDPDLVTGSVHWAPWSSPSEDPGRRSTSLLEPAGGYTGVTVGGRHLGVQHSREGSTRIGWSAEGACEFSVALHLPAAPVPALEFVLRCRNLP